MRYALIRDGLVVNVIDASPEFAASIAGEWDAVTPTLTAGPGWSYVGGEFTAPPAPAPSVPARVTRRQGRQALLLAGKLALVQPAINAIPDELQRAMAQIWWEDAQDFERSNAMLQTLAVALELDDAALDALFTMAAAL